MLSFPLKPQNHKEDKELPLSSGSSAVTHHSEELVQPCPREFFKQEELAWQCDVFKLMYKVNKMDQVKLLSAMLEVLGPNLSSKAPPPPHTKLNTWK